MTDQNNQNGSVSANGLVLSSAWYNRLKWFTLIFLPAFGSFYYGLSLVWEALPLANQVVGTAALLATFLGVVLGISDRNFQKQGADGSLDARVDGDQVILSRLALPNITPEELASKKSVTIQINPGR